MISAPWLCVTSIPAGSDTDAMDALEAMVEEFKPDVLMLDPLVELHTAEENDNTGLRAVVAHFRTLAKRHNIGLVLAHHTRKGTTMPGDPDAIRGAGSIVGAVRVAMTVCTMNEEEAKRPVSRGDPQTLFPGRWRQIELCAA